MEIDEAIEILQGLMSYAKEREYKALALAVAHLLTVE